MKIGPISITFFGCLLCISPASAQPQADEASSKPVTTCSIPKDPPIYSEVIPTSFVPRNPGPNDWKKSFVAPDGRTVTVLVQAPQGTGTYSRPIRCDETPDEYFPAVVSEAVKAHAHHLVIPYGVYDFVGPDMRPDNPSCNINTYGNCNPHWTIGSFSASFPALQDLDIDGSGSILNFNAPTTGIQMWNVLRVRLHNFTIDWPRTPMSALGTIVADPTNPGHNAVVIDDAFPVSDYPVAFTPNGKYPEIISVNRWTGETKDDLGHFTSINTSGSQANAMVFAWALNNLPNYVGKTSAGNQTFSCSNCLFLTGEGSNQAANCNWITCANFDYFAHGTRVSLRYVGAANNTSYAIAVNASDDVDLDHITLLANPDLAIGGGDGGHRGFRIADSTLTRKPGVPISSEADGINIGFQMDVMITDNDLGYGGDDAINLWTGVLSVTNATNLTRSGGTVITPSYCGYPLKDYAVPGDWVAFFDDNQVYLDSAHVASANTCANGQSELTVDRCASGNCVQTLAGLTSTDIFINLTEQSAARFWVSGNYNHDNSGNGFRTSAPYGFVAGNTLADNVASNILLDAGSGNGMGSSNVIVQDNFLTRSGASAEFDGALWVYDLNTTGAPQPSSVFQKITIIDNTIDEVPGPGILMSSAGNICMSGNVIHDSNMIKKNPVLWNNLTSLDSVLVLETTNGTLCGTTLTGTSGLIGIDTSDTNVTVSPSCP